MNPFRTYINKTPVLHVTHCNIIINIPTFYHRIRGRTEDQIIHPESEANVQNTRTHLQEQNRLPPPREPTAPPHPENRQRQEGEVTCPVCIGNAQFAVETNCGHIFCGMLLGNTCTILTLTYLFRTWDQGLQKFRVVNQVHWTTLFGHQKHFFTVQLKKCLALNKNIFYIFR